MIFQQIRRAVEIVLLIHCGMVCRGREQMRSAQLHQLMLEEYRRVVDDLPDSMFTDPSIKASMKLKLFNAQSNLNGKQLWKKQQDWLKVIRNEYVTNMAGGLRLSDLPSGTSLRDAMTGLIVRKWKDQNQVCLLLSHVIHSIKQILT